MGLPEFCLSGSIYKPIEKECTTRKDLVMDIMDWNTSSARVSAAKGASRVHCIVEGPRETKTSAEDLDQAHNKGRISCTVIFGKVCFIDRMFEYNSERISRFKAFLESSLLQAVKESIIVERFPMSVLDIKVSIYSVDEMILPVMINAASLALASSTIDCRGLVCASRVNAGDNNSITVCLLPVAQKATFLYTEGDMAMGDLGKAMSKAFNSCGEVDKAIKKSIKRYLVGS